MVSSTVIPGGRRHALRRPLRRHLRRLPRRRRDPRVPRLTSRRSTTTSSTPGPRRTRSRSTTCSATTAKRNWDSERRLARPRGRRHRRRGDLPQHRSRRSSPVARWSRSRPPADAHDLELRWAGLQAHNRWLADFCARRPGRRAGDRADPAARRRRARSRRSAGRTRGGLTGGVLLPGAPPGLGLPPLHDARLRADLGGVRGARHARQPPQRQRGAADTATDPKTS